MNPDKGVNQLGTTSLGEKDIAERARARHARRTILRRLGAIILVGLAFGAVAVGVRDTVHIQNALQALEPFQRTLQAEQDATHRLPLALPKTTPAGQPLPEKAMTYLSKDAVPPLRTFDGPILAGYTPYVSNVWREDGRAVLIVEGDRCRVEWLDIHRFSDWNKQQEAWVREFVARQLRADAVPAGH